MKQSLVLIVAEPQVRAADELLRGLGWSDDNFRVALASDGMTGVTHYGLRASVGPGFADSLARAVAEQPALAAALTISIRDDDARLGQFSDALKAQGLAVAAPQVE